MPITLGCPSCGKRFRARDQSAGKRVRCPYCQAAVHVPSPAEVQNAAAPTEVVGQPGPAGAPFPPQGSSGSVRRPSGRSSASLPAPPGEPAPVAPVAPAAGWESREPTESLPDSGKPASGVVVTAARPASAAPPSSGRVARASRVEITVDQPEGKRKPTPQQRAAAGWRKARQGLFWVMAGLVFLALPGFVGFGSRVYERSFGSLPGPNDPGRLTIEGYVNTGEAGTLRLSARDELNLLVYGVPVVLGGLLLGFGRLTCGAVPRSSGAKGMFALSGLFTLVALAGVLFAAGARYLHFDQEFTYALPGTLIALGVAELWFLLGLGVCGAVLKRPRAARAAGLVVLAGGIVAGLAAASVATEWEVLDFRPKYALGGAEPAAKQDAAAPGLLKNQPAAGKGKQDKGPVIAPPAPPEPVAPDPDVKEGQSAAKKADTGTKDYTAVLRQSKRTGDAALYESAGGMLAWLLLIGTYWRAAGTTRWAIGDWLDQIEEED
jgi:hypothetical protein